MQMFRKPFAAFGRVGVIAVIAVAVFAGGLGIGTGMTSTGAQTSAEIQGCVSRFTGALRIVTGPVQCSTGERAISWGSVGPGGILDIQQVTETTVVTTDDERDRASVFAVCPAGYTIVGGGGGLGTASGDDDWFTARSGPFEAGDGVFDDDGWGGSFKTVSGQDAVGQYIFDITAICVLTS